ncbi:MAG: FMN-binding negative transcriptional regulator [Microcella sp.]
MRHTPHYILDDRDEVRRLVRENPWATIVSNVAERGIVASHYPVLLDEAASTGDEIVLVSHVGRPDEQLHRLGEGEVLVIVQGPHGYVSPSWYAPGDIVPTWNHVTAHLYGVPEILDDAENFRILCELTDHFERAMGEEARSLAIDEEYSRRVAQGTVGLRLRVTRVDARLKLSQNKSGEVVDRIIDQLEGDGPYAHAGLAREMRRVHDPRRS